MTLMIPQYRRLSTHRSWLVTGFNWPGFRWKWSVGRGIPTKPYLGRDLICFQCIVTWYIRRANRETTICGPLHITWSTLIPHKRFCNIYIYIVELSVQCNLRNHVITQGVRFYTHIKHCIWEKSSGGPSFRYWSIKGDAVSCDEGFDSWMERWTIVVLPNIV